MRLSRIVIKNFRNFKHFDVRLGEHAVVLGENKVGKTNLLFALRLILDPALPDSSRRLRIDDFWDGLARPLKAEDVIEVSVEFRDFENNENLLAVLADHLVRPDPMVARVTYRYQPVQGLEGAPRSEADYEFILFGGGRIENAIGYELRRWMPMDLFPALRDAESDLARWSRSPLRPLLDRAAKTVDAKALSAIAGEVHATTSKIAALPELSDVVSQVNDQLTVMVGDKHAVKTALGFAPTEPERLLRALQMMIDSGKRGVAEASLGSANVLYLALKHLEHQYLVDEGERQHTFLAIEEPEAHLHPHLQRLIYRNYLQTRDEVQADTEPRSILLTTHSPNVASVAPLANVVVLRHVVDAGHTVGRSLKGVKLNTSDREDLERYIDVTRGELFFSKGVILVEGDAEKFLLPTLAKLNDKALDFDAMGISVCSIAGTNFAPYVQLLGQKGLDIPFVVLTDFDPKNQAVSQEDADPDDNGVGNSYGKNRVVNQIMRHLLDEEVWDKSSYGEVLELAPKHGIFLNEFTFEIDLFKAGAEDYFHTAIGSLTTNKKMHARFKGMSADPDSLDPSQFLKDIDSIGKGRVAQRLAAVLVEESVDVCPTYIKKALKYLKAKLA
ncbi:AAA ATPase domain protein [Paraburkholderia xenovorans LB400]|jgi:putative ATP-dependent endonuclease of the OLD family|uniref:Predicted ATP-dependent endonuclease of the OLD family n=1 Tax=Paraburkholderia xenovorans (strain LB400) TaxID=266265 RepID=Q13ZS1_PARXL|nr:Predicted ATP-dependent endonuclease of the OLD family [Paraburkholderia xenovorans LB400]AIP29918.1 AAA ATPase domain protein [Paraburkholderia xenovorans LB400]